MTASPHDVVMAQTRALQLVRRRLASQGGDFPCAGPAEGVGQQGRQGPAMHMTHMRMAVLVMPGSFNPVHTDHVAVLRLARDHIERETGALVVAGLLQPSSDKYLVHKCGPQGAMALHDRVAACVLAVQGAGPHGGTAGSSGGGVAADADDATAGGPETVAEPLGPTPGEDAAGAGWLGVWRSGKASGSSASRDCGAFFAGRIAEALGLLAAGWGFGAALAAVRACAGTGGERDLHRACACASGGATGGGAAGATDGGAGSASLDHHPGAAALAHGVVVETVQVCGADFVARTAGIGGQTVRGWARPRVWRAHRGRGMHGLCARAPVSLL